MKALGLIGWKIVDDSFVRDGGWAVDPIYLALSSCPIILFGKPLLQSSLMEARCLSVEKAGSSDKQVNCKVC